MIHTYLLEVANDLMQSTVQDDRSLGKLMSDVINDDDQHMPHAAIAYLQQEINSCLKNANDPSGTDERQKASKNDVAATWKKSDRIVFDQGYGVGRNLQRGNAEEVLQELRRLLYALNARPASAPRSATERTLLIDASRQLALETSPERRQLGALLSRMIPADVDQVPFRILSDMKSTIVQEMERGPEASTEPQTEKWARQAALEWLEDSSMEGKASPRWDEPTLVMFSRGLARGVAFQRNADAAQLRALLKTLEHVGDWIRKSRVTLSA